MSDADHSYNFKDLSSVVKKLRDGFDLVIRNLQKMSPKRVGDQLLAFKGS